MSINDSALREYAKLLSGNGFTIYEPKGVWNFFLYSRMVDGRECFGNVQKADFGGYEHSMPIRPSRENGSHMFVDGVPDELTIEAATAIAQPQNRNHLIGTQQNHKEVRDLERSFTRW